MTYYRLVASGRSDVDVSEIVLSRDADGEVEHRVTTAEATEIPEELLADAWKVADSIGYRIAEVEVSSEEGAEGAEEDQPVSVDTVAGSPEVSAETGETPVPSQQGQVNPDTSTASAPASAPSNT